MNLRKYLGVLTVVLAVYGVVYQQQIDVPNQEIVLQFTNNEVASDEAQYTVAIVKQQLQNIGVNNIQVLEQEDGKLKITYYSDTDVASIKTLLSKEKELALGYVSFNQNENQNNSPSEHTEISYDLDVIEIQNGNDVDVSIEGKFVLELEPRYDQIFNPNVFMSLNDIDVKENDRIVKVRLKVSRNITLAIDNISHIIPEVRAGPIS